MDNETVRKGTGRKRKSTHVEEEEKKDKDERIQVMTRDIFRIHLQDAQAFRASYQEWSAQWK